MMSFFLVVNNLCPLDLAVCTLISKLFAIGNIAMDPNFLDTEKALEEGEVKGC